ncbi:MAG TPA: hypothetical protein VJ936_01640, partial [Desulfobacteraceae bacterium]|nr:hypothetical protein [Desulfobacteraceae bacterium]
MYDHYLFLLPLFFYFTRSGLSELHDFHITAMSSVLTTKIKTVLRRPQRIAPASTRTSEGFFTCQPKNQELRASVSSNSLIFLTPGREKILISFGSQVPAGANPLGALT